MMGGVIMSGVGVAMLMHVVFGHLGFRMTWLGARHSQCHAPVSAGDEAERDQNDQDPAKQQAHAPRIPNVRRKGCGLKNTVEIDSGPRE